MLNENFTRLSQLFRTTTLLSPPVVVQRDPFVVTQPSPPLTNAVRVCPLRHARTKERLSFGFISPETDVVNEPLPNCSRFVGGYDARVGGTGGLGTGSGVPDGVGFGVARLAFEDVGDGEGIGEVVAFPLGVFGCVTTFVLAFAIAGAPVPI